MRQFVFALALVTAACSNKSTDSSSPGSTGAVNDTKASQTAAAADDLADVDLKPLPLSIRVPKGGMGAMDMSMGDKKSLTVDIGEGALNVQQMVEKDLAELKKGYKADKILFPFKKFAKEDAASFIVEFETDAKKPGFIGVTVKDIGGKKYVCKTTGLEGLKTVEIAEKHLKSCDSLKAK
jgi:hypothetical protein